MQYWRLCKRSSRPLRMRAEFFNGTFAVFALITPDVSQANHIHNRVFDYPWDFPDPNASWSVLSRAVRLSKLV